MQWLLKGRNHNGCSNQTWMNHHKQVGNRDIRWEKSTQYDLGLDFALFDYRLTGSISGYIKDTKDLIWSFDFPPSATVGSMQMNRNIGALTNRGYPLVYV